MKILHLISSPRGAASDSIRLGNAIVEKLQQLHADSTVTVHDLTSKPFPHLEESHLNSFFTPLEKRSPEQITAIRHSDEAIALIKNADAIVIGAPMYNFSIHSTLKAFIDHISRAGETFRYTENGPEGLVKNKKVYLAISSGGVYSEGPMKSADFIDPYLRFFLGFIGMKDITTFRLEGLKVPGVMETAFDKALAAIDQIEAGELTVA